MYPIQLPRTSTDPLPPHQRFSMQDPDQLLNGYAAPPPDPLGVLMIRALDAVGDWFAGRIETRRIRSMQRRNDVRRPGDEVVAGRR